MCDYIVNEDITWHLTHFLSFNCLLVVVQLNSSLNALIKATLFYKQLATLQNRGENKLSFCYSAGYIQLLSKLRGSNRSIVCPKSYVYAAGNNHLNVLCWCLSAGLKIKHLNAAIKNAASNGHVEAMQWLKENGTRFASTAVTLLKPVSYYENTLYQAARNNDLPVLKWFIREGFRFTFSASQIDTLIEKDLFPVVQYLMDMMPVTYSYRSLIWAANNGRLDVLRSLQSIGYTGKYPCEVMNGAIENNHVPVLDWLLARSMSYSNKSIAIAVQKDHIGVLQWFITHNIDGPRSTSRMIKTAILYNKVNILQWLYQLGIDFTYRPYIVYRAAVKGNLESLIVLKNRGCSREAAFRAIFGAVQCNHLAIFRLFEPPKLKPKHVKKIVKSAAEYNSISILDYLKLNYAIKCSKKLVCIAAGEGNVQVLNWLHRECAPFKCDISAVDNALTSNQINVLDWFQTNNYFTGYSDYIIDFAAKFGRIEVLHWLKNSGHPFVYSSRAIDGAAERGQLGVLDWFSNSGYPFIYTSKAIIKAARNHHLPILHWFKSKGYPLHCSTEDLKKLFNYYLVTEPIIQWFSEAGFDTTGYHR